ncbi:hypothetical protein L207DRAFT_585312 [Hyaloscypha variabilis F]|uniref:Uncharacterized protein n=1 Tax=Hyaloscypha variabilis (strain UAMH 11265 / GT02V1 / F) TaxID=1149755 RepID=A0A2J6RIQ4_HYAVF|nr:hypothetical protein L207DRAFT_585312 [Hyaloscypha variabilis F]
MYELQKTLVKRNFAIHFYCTSFLLSLQKPDTYPIQKELKRLQFHWRGEIYRCDPEPQGALGRLQTLLALTTLIIKITRSLPLSERVRFLEKKGFTSPSRDFCFTVADAIGFDELCSVRGLEAGIWRSIVPPDDEHPDIKWIGRRKENYHRTMEGLPYLGL